MMDNVKAQLDRLLIAYKVQPAGWGYIDCIIKKENVRDFLNALNGIGIKAYGVTWWCHCTERGREVYGCPHGGGGPQSEFYDGYFSEMYHMPMKKVSDREDILHYIFVESKSEKFYSPCIEPALWLDVPDDWRNAME